MKIHNWLMLVSSLVIGITLVFSGCEGGSVDTSSTTDTETTVTDPLPTDTVLNDDPSCELALKYQNRYIQNNGQVHYVNRVLTSEPFGLANPVCVQYNDTRTGEVTVWKELTSKGRRVDKLPSGCGIDKVVIFYE